MLPVIDPELVQGARIEAAGFRILNEMVHVRFQFRAFRYALRNSMSGCGMMEERTTGKGHMYGLYRCVWN